MSRVYGAPVVGRRNCTRCKRWRHAIDFRCRKRDPEAGEALILDHRCNHCHAELARSRKPTEEQRVKRNKYKRAWRRRKDAARGAFVVGRHPQSQPRTGRRGAVSRVPIARLLKSKLKKMKLRELAFMLEIDEKRLRAVIYGYTLASGGKNGNRLTSVDYIEIGTVDAWLIRLGEPADTLERLYPLD